MGPRDDRLWTVRAWTLKARAGRLERPDPYRGYRTCAPLARARIALLGVARDRRVLGLRPREPSIAPRPACSGVSTSLRGDRESVLGRPLHRPSPPPFPEPPRRRRDRASSRSPPGPVGPPGRTPANRGA